jgi:hypothetical protein
MDSAAVVPAMLLSAAVSATTVNAAPAPHQLMPVPADLRLGAGGLPVFSGFTVAVDGHRDDRLLGAISRAMRRLEGRTGLEFPRALAGEASAATLVVVAQGPGLTRRMEASSVRLEELGLTHEKNYGMMLRRLAGGREAPHLRTLADAVEPVKVYARGAQRPHTQMTPLTRLVDAARPDSRVARELATAVGALLDDAPRFQAGREAAEAVLARWREASAALPPLIAGAPVLQEVEPLARDLGTLADVGGQAFTKLAAGPPAAASWRDEKLAFLRQAAAPRAQLEFPSTLLGALRELVVASAERDRAGDVPREEWARQVRARAAEAAPPPREQ